MDFELSPALAELQARARRVAEESVAPHAAAVDQTPRYPDEAVAAMAAAGLLGSSFPEDLGGRGLGTFGLVLATEEVAKYCASSGLVLTLARLSTAPVLLAGTDDQRSRYAGAVARGEAAGSFCLTEPGAGSDVSAMATRAERDGDGYRLTGTKSWVSQYREARFYTVFARTGDDERPVSCFVVDRDSPGLSLGEPGGKMGVRGVATGDVVMDGVLVPESSRVGEEGDGFRIAMHALNSMRPVIGARAVGLAEGAFEYARAFALERVAFGRPIAQIQWVQFTLAEMAMEIEAARLLTYRAGWLADAGKVGAPYAGLLATSKAFPSEVAERVASSAVQILGARGYSTEHPVERAFRDARQLQIVEGTSQIQRLIMARSILAGDLGFGGWHGVPEPKP